MKVQLIQLVTMFNYDASNVGREAALCQKVTNHPLIDVHLKEFVKMSGGPKSRTQCQGEPDNCELFVLLSS